MTTAMENTPTTLKRALVHELARADKAAFLEYDVAVALWHLYRTGGNATGRLRIVNPRPSRADVRRVLGEMIQAGSVQETKLIGTGTHAFVLIGRKPTGAAEFACAINPLACMSHLSSMEYHGLTDRLPGQLYLTAPADRSWRGQARRLMAADLGNDAEMFEAADLPVLRPVAPQQLQGRAVHWHAGETAGAFRALAAGLRVTSIGRTFLDMTRAPALCGGINHVLDVFESQARIHVRSIVDEVQRHGGPIDKVRLGWLLQERGGLSDPAFDGWAALAARGGSRKLDPQAPYSPLYSPRWCLSLNAEAAHADAQA